MESGRKSRAFELIYRYLLQIVLFTAPSNVHGAPITLHPRFLSGSVDPGPGVWADTLSGISPLILLVGERGTKQNLRNMRGIHDAFSFAVAPFGLIGLMTSVLRFCGPQQLRAFIGHELESRVIAGVEVTRVNCGGVHAELVDGYIVRSTAADSSGQATAVSMLEGEFDTHATEAVLQIQACDKFKLEKTLAGIPDDVAPVHWCLHLTTAAATRGVVISMIKTLAEANGIKNMGGAIQRFQHALGDYYSCSIDEGIPASTFGDKDNVEILVSNRSNEKGIGGNQASISKPVTAQLTFLCTLEAVSEFTTSTPASKNVTYLLGIMSLLSILVLQFVTLYHDDWQPSVGWILMFLGYIGIVLGVLAGALLIHSSCTCIILENCSATSDVGWVDGLVISVKNADTLDTSGSNFMHSPSRAQTFEVVWRKDLTSQKSLIASAIVSLLVLSCLCHYLGLRSSVWWLGVGELLVCLTAAVARAINRDHQEKFTIVEGVKIDQRCSSTGIIHMQKAEKIDQTLWNAGSLDVRAYSEQSCNQSPMTSEHIAWHAAKLCIEDGRISTRILELTGMLLAITGQEQKGRSRATFASFLGGVLVKEGLAFPNTRLCIGFCSSIAELAAPTPLLARAIMQQPEWIVNNPELGHNAIPIGNVNIFAISSMMTWWTISENRNDMGDLQGNLHWSFLLINIAFFISLLTMPEKDLELVDIIEEVQKPTHHEKQTSEALVRFFQGNL